MKLSDFNYDFPEELIATEPLPERDASRMMVMRRSDGSIVHSKVRDLPGFLAQGDIVVMNNTKVFPARLVGRKESGGYYEVLLLEMAGGRGQGKEWKCITDQTRTSRPGLRIIFKEGLVGTIKAREGEQLVIEFNDPSLIEKAGLPPVPPYIRKMRKNGKGACGEAAVDKERYQTVYARENGSSAAPTAGLHFTERLLKKIEEAGARIVYVTLHVGIDTFSPVRVENIEEHRMHGEEYSVPEETMKAVEGAKANGGRVIAVGTTSVRALESFFSQLPRPGMYAPERLRTELFIAPGYEFRVVDAIFTNFHQPESTLLMMVSAFAGREHVMKAYHEAISQKYRLFSYGDSMLIV